MSRLSFMIKDFISGPTIENGFNYGMWYLLPRDTKILIRKLCEESEMFEKAADSFARENIELKKEIEELKDKNRMTLFPSTPRRRKELEINNVVEELKNSHAIRIERRGYGVEIFLGAKYKAIEEENERLKLKVKELEKLFEYATGFRK